MLILLCLVAGFSLRLEELKVECLPPKMALLSIQGSPEEVT